MNHLKPRDVAGPVTVIVLSTLPFLPGLTNQFIFDDRPALLENKALNSSSPLELLSLDYWGTQMSSNSSHKSYRPLTALTFWSQAKWTGDMALRMKAVNLGINGMNGLLVFSLMKLLIKLTRYASPDWLSLSTAAMYCVHPVHTEPVLSIVGRCDLLYSFFLLCAVHVYLRADQSQASKNAALYLKYCTVTLLAACSLLSKEQGIVVLPVLGALELMKLVRQHGSKGGRSSSVCFILYCGLCTLCFAFARLKVAGFRSPTFQSGDNPAAAATDWISRWCSLCYIHALNAWILLCPQWLCFDWAFNCVPLIHSLQDRRNLATLCFWAVLVLLFIRSARVRSISSSRLVYVALLLLIAPFILCSNILVFVGFVIGERNLYLPVLGFILLYHIGLLRLMHRSTKPCLLYLPHIFTILLLSVRTVDRSLDWQSETALYTSGLTVCPDNAKVYYNLAKMQYDGTKGTAALLYKEAVRLEPNYEQALNNLGNLLRLSDPKSAEMLLRRAVRVNPRFPAAHMNLAIVLQATGQYMESEQMYLTALSLRKPYADCSFNLGNLYLKTGELDKAEDRFREGAALGHELSFINLSVLLDQTQRLVDARRTAEAGLVKFPRNPNLHFHRANALGQLDEYEQAEAAYQTALQLEERSSYYTNLGVLYHRWGRAEEAKASYRSALRLQPDNRNAAKYLKSIKI